MTDAAAPTARFPALDPEPPPRSLRSRVLRATVSLLVVLVLVGGVRFAWVAASDGSSSPVQSASILAYSRTSAALSITSVGHGTTTSYPSLGPVDGGLLATPDGQTLISSTGRTVTLKSGRPVGTSTKYFAALANGGFISDLADAGRYLAVSSGGGFASPVSLVATDSTAAHPLGSGDGIAGDPTRPALYVAVAGGQSLRNSDGDFVSPDQSIEHRGIGITTTVLTTAATVAAQLHWPSSAPITLGAVPNPTGTLVAVVASPFAPQTVSPGPDQAPTPPPPDGVAVYTTDGALVGVRPSVSPYGVGWSPDGRSLLYGGTAGGTVTAWTPIGDVSTTMTLPTGIAALGRCVWAPDRRHAMCAGITPGPDEAIAAWCLLDLRAATVRSYPQSTEPVLWESP